METLKDFLCWYNNLDVKPFLEAIEKQTAVSKGIDMFKQHVSIPGIAVQFKFYELKDHDINIPSITYRNQDLFKTVILLLGQQYQYHQIGSKGTKTKSK